MNQPEIGGGARARLVLVGGGRLSIILKLEFLFLRRVETRYYSFTKFISVFFVFERQFLI